MHYFLLLVVASITWTASTMSSHLSFGNKYLPTITENIIKVPFLEKSEQAPVFLSEKCKRSLSEYSGLKPVILKCINGNFAITLKELKHTFVDDINNIPYSSCVEVRDPDYLNGIRIESEVKDVSLFFQMMDHKNSDQYSLKEKKRLIKIMTLLGSAHSNASLFPLAEKLLINSDKKSL